MSPVVVIGLGNRDRGDDAAGREVARRLRRLGLRGLDIVELNGEGLDVLARLETAGAAILVDACMSGAPPGTLRRFDVANAPLPAGAFGLSAHGFGLCEAIELARILGKLPPRCIVYAIEGAHFNVGAAISKDVLAAIDRVAEAVRVEVEGLS